MHKTKGRRFNKSGALLLSSKRKKNRGENFRKNRNKNLVANAASAVQTGNSLQETSKEENMTVTSLDMNIKIEPYDDYEEPSLPVIGEVFSKNNSEADVQKENRCENAKQDLYPRIKAEICSEFEREKCRADTDIETFKTCQENLCTSSANDSQNITPSNSGMRENDEYQKDNSNSLLAYCEENETLLKSVIKILNDRMKEDKFDLIGKLCALRLKSLRANQCSYAKTLISEVIENAELGYQNYKYVLPKTFHSRCQRKNPISDKSNSNSQEKPLNEVCLFTSYITYANVHKPKSQYFCSGKNVLLDKIKKMLDDCTKKDQFDELGEYYAKRLRAVSNREYTNAEKLITDILFYAELGCLYPDILTLNKLTDYAKKFFHQNIVVSKKKNVSTQTLSSEVSLSNKSKELTFQTLIKSADLLMEKSMGKSAPSVTNINIKQPVLPFSQINSNSTSMQANSSSGYQNVISNLKPTVYSNASCILPLSYSSDAALSDKLDQLSFQTLLKSANLLRIKPSVDAEAGKSDIPQNSLCLYPPSSYSSSVIESSLSSPVQTVIKSPDLHVKKSYQNFFFRNPMKNKAKKSKSAREAKIKDLIFTVPENISNSSLKQTTSSCSVILNDTSGFTHITVPSQSFPATDSTSNKKIAAQKLIELADIHKSSTKVVSMEDCNESLGVGRVTEVKDVCLKEESDINSSCPAPTTNEIFSSPSTFATESPSAKSKELIFSTLTKTTKMMKKKPSRRKSYRKCTSKLLPSALSKKLNQNNSNLCSMDTNSSFSDSSNNTSISFHANESCSLVPTTSAVSSSDKSDKSSEISGKPVDLSTKKNSSRKSPHKSASKSSATDVKAKETVSPVTQSNPSSNQESSFNPAVSKRTSNLTSAAQKIAPKFPISSSIPTSSCTYPPMISAGISNVTPNSILSTSSITLNTDAKQSVVPLTHSVSIPSSIQTSSSCSFSPTVISNIAPTFAPFNSFVTLPVNSQPSVYMIPMNQPSHCPSTMNSGPVQFLNILPKKI